MHPRTRRHAAAATLTAASVVATLTLGAPATADPNNNSSKKLQKAVTLDGVMQHVEEFQDIADANGGNRAAGTPGYDASAEYVHDQLAAAGYDVEYQTFPFFSFEEITDAEFEQVSPDAAVYTVNEDFATMTFSGSGDVTDTVQGVDLNLGGASTSGCEASDFDAFTAGNIALIRRGACSFRIKAENAEAAGATAVIIFNTNEGDPAFGGTLGEGAPAGIPVIGTSYAIGVDLNDPSDTVARVRTDAVTEAGETVNVIAQTTEGRTDNVVMAGAHLDSVPAGPGFNDNGSGSAALLETALQMKKVKPNNQVRFAWWGAEELGLVGSTYYVNNLSDEELEDIALYLNFDMVGSPNYMRGVYDGTGDLGGTAPRPEGSAAIEMLFNEHFESKDLPYQDTEFSGRSDYQAFINNGIPAGGLFTGAEGLKTAEEAALYGGVAGEQYDPCYHEVCDSATPVADGATGAGNTTYTVNADELVGNVNTVALDTNADAIAHAVITYAFDTSLVNGESSPGKSHGKAPAHAGADDHGRMAS